MTKDSVHFHVHLGYTHTAHFHKCGYKFNRWYDIVWMEKTIREHKEKQPAVRSFAEILSELNFKKREPISIRLAPVYFSQIATMSDMISILLPVLFYHQLPREYETFSVK